MDETDANISTQVVLVKRGEDNMIPAAPMPSQRLATFPILNAKA